MNNKKTPFSAGIILGALIGGVAAYFLSPRTGKENREMAKEKWDEMKQKMEGKKLDEVIKEIFGQANEEGKRLYTLAKTELNSRLSILEESLDEIDRDKYKGLVVEVIARLEKEADATKDRMAKLQDYLMHRWDMAQEQAKSDAGDVATEAKKAIKKNKNI